LTVFHKLGVVVLVDQKHSFNEFLVLQDVFSYLVGIVKCKHTITKWKQRWTNTHLSEQT